MEKKILDKANQQGIINESQKEQLLELFKLEGQNKKVFNFSNLLYYFGGFLSIMAITIFMQFSYDSFKEVGLLITSSILFIIGLFLSHQYINKNNNIPSGIFAAFSICLTPLIIYCIQVIFGFMDMDYEKYHKYINPCWLYMEIGTLAAASLLLYKLRFPFMIFPVAVTLWYFSMDLAMFIADIEYASWKIRRQISMFFGLGMIALAVFVDYKSSRDNDFPFWLYIFGVICFWGGLTFTSSSDELLKFIYFLINLTMMLISLILARRVFVIFGSIGSFIYLSHLAGNLFEGELAFSLSLVCIGFLIIKLGMVWNAKSEYYEKKFRSIFSQSTNDFIDKIRS